MSILTFFYRKIALVLQLQHLLASRLRSRMTKLSCVHRASRFRVNACRRSSRASRLADSRVTHTATSGLAALCRTACSAIALNLQHMSDQIARKAVV